MKKLKLKFKIISFGILAVLILFIVSNYNNIKPKIDNYKNRENIIIEIEKMYNSKTITTESIEKINEYIELEDKDAQYYFTLGYLDYIDNNYKNAIKNFELAKDKISKFDQGFVKIYTYILLNESLIQLNQYDNLVENCKTAFSYISKDKNYRNNTDVIWNNISTLTYMSETLNESTSILNSYIEETRGLSKESKARLISNLGSLYMFNYKYVDATYYYLYSIDIINSSDNIENKNIHNARLLINIADINFILNNYEDAIDYYRSAINLNIEDKRKSAIAKSIAYINEGASYIELKEYDKAIEVSEEATGILQYLDKDSKDDIEILINNNLALANIYKHNLDKAEELLDKSTELLKNDKVEFSLDKEIFINISYAELYRAKKMYDESLKIYEDTLQTSIQKGLGLEEKIYKFMAETYKSKKDLNNYIKYIELYKNESDLNEKEVKKEYINSVNNLYTNDKLKERETLYTIYILFFIFVIILLCITVIAKLRAIKTLNKSNFTDGMTNLYNRKYLDYYISKNNDNIIEKEISIILIDIDYFKKYNDNYGHIKGDEIIKEVANSLKNSIRKQDVAIRYGGEEMVIILPGVSSDRAQSIAKDIQKNIKEKQIEHKYSEVNDLLTISIGIYSKIYSTNENIYNMIDKADKALYKAKNNGRNKYEVFYD